MPAPAASWIYLTHRVTPETNAALGTLVAIQSQNMGLSSTSPHLAQTSKGT